MTVTKGPPDPDVIAPRPGEELDADAVGRYLAGKMPGAEGTPEIWQFPGGHANLTYLVHYPTAKYVLRRGPHGDVAASAHDMGREYRVPVGSVPILRARAPRVRLLRGHERHRRALLQMERRHGLVVRRDIPPEFGGGKDPAKTRKLSEVIIDTLADFHAVDPKAAGLEGLGKPEGYLQRQVKGWSDRWNRAKTKELQSADEVVAWLNTHQPPRRRRRSRPQRLAARQHGRRRQTTRGAASRCTTGTCTVGDRSRTHALSWYEPNSRTTSFPHAVARAGLMTRGGDRRYGKRGGRDVSTMPYYYVFGLFKMTGVVSSSTPLQAGSDEGRAHVWQARWSPRDSSAWRTTT